MRINLRRAKLIDMSRKDGLEWGLKAFDDEAKMEGAWLYLQRVPEKVS